MTIQASLPIPGFVSTLIQQQTARAPNQLPAAATSQATRGDAAGLSIGASAKPGQPTAELKSAAKTEAQKLLELDKKKAAFKEFEGIFVSMLIKELRKGTELFAGDSTDSLGVLFDQHIGKAIGDSGGIGIAQQLSRYVEAQEL